MVFSGEKLKIKSIKTDEICDKKNYFIGEYNVSNYYMYIDDYYRINIYAIKGRTKQGEI